MGLGERTRSLVGDAQRRVRGRPRAPATKTNAQTLSETRIHGKLERLIVAGCRLRELEQLACVRVPVRGMCIDVLHPAVLLTVAFARALTVALVTALR